MNGGHLAVAALEAGGVDTVFGIPATHVIEIYDGLRESKTIRTIVARSDQNAAYMADGYARRTRKPGVAVVTGGPGLAQAIPGLVTAWADSSPLVVITSDLDPEARMRRQAGIPHEIYDAQGLARSTGAHVFVADRPDEVYEAVSESLTACMVGRARPSVCLLSRGALEGPAESRFVRPDRAFPNRSDGSAPDPQQLSLAVQLLAEAERPIVLIGAGVLAAQAEELLDSFLESSDLPYLTTVPAVSAVDTRKPGYRGVALDPQGHQELSRADVILAIGASFGWATTGSNSLELPGQLIHVDIDPDEFGKHYTPALSIAADAAAFLQALLDSFPQIKKMSNRRGRNDLGIQGDRTAGSGNRWIAAIDRALPERNASVVVDVTMSQLALVRGLTFTPARRFFLPWNAQTLGYAYSAALGVQATAKEEFVLAVMGDGGALYVLGELGTAVENDLPVCLLVFNNHSYGTIALAQDDMCGGRRFAVDLAQPDFCQVAAAFGARARRVESPEGLEDAINEAVQDRRPRLIEVLVPFDAFILEEVL